jgi:hypothetical protein
MDEGRDELPKNKAARRRELHRRQNAASAAKGEANRARRRDRAHVQVASDRASVLAQLEIQASVFRVEPLIRLGDEDLADLPDGMVEFSQNLFDVRYPTTADDLPALVQLVVALILRWADQQPDPQEFAASMSDRCGLRLEVNDELSADETTFRWEPKPGGPFSQVAMMIANRVALLGV